MPNPGWNWSSVEAAAGVSSAPEPSWVTNGYELGRVAMLGYAGLSGPYVAGELMAPLCPAAWVRVGVRA